MSLCRGCGSQIEWIKTTAGRNMPVDPEPVFVIEGDGRDRFVTDDGAGIPAGRLAELRESFEHDLTNEYAAHVGLYNIQKVIRLTYGAPYGVQIESTEGQGTAVTLTIPYEVEENEGC